MFISYSTLKLLMDGRSRVFGPHILELGLSIREFSLFIHDFYPQLFVGSFDTFYVAVSRSAEILLDRLDRVCAFVWFLVQPYENLCEPVNHASLLQVFTEVFFFLLRCLSHCLDYLK